MTDTIYMEPSLVIHTGEYVSISLDTYGELRVYRGDSKTSAGEKIPLDSNADEILDAIMRLCAELKS